jgi:para-nitrobenzyl esterase
MGGSIGAFHGLDEAFVWGALNPSQNGLVDDRPETQAVSQEMRQALYRFAATGDPGWPAYTSDEPASRIFGGGASGEKVAEVDSDFLAAWDGVVRN